MGSEVLAVSTAVVSIPEISCAACKTAIEGALNPLNGVRAAVVDVAAKRVSVDFDEALIEGQGYAVAADG
jgi:copper chaperone